ncbi:flagellar motor protein MotB [Acidihalobacter ferrooxydans]|uniref:OmpA-like domain-containing protein n=1 Tax=Acidihalobacter ferrooxydans TaxID=1765967 RepID=A0A1P8UGM0_9GAMM|nr:flagellar motor protein MotB [Acidihalobacter ferrooxydans]APZ42982.1 hypothetical protein BW247_07650 [Acidihalobacter ferrooxydans]
MDDKKQPIVIKKVVKHQGHHGGAWKVAYADFVTAMMAFFLLMWLLGSTTPQQRAGLSQFFTNPSAIQGPGGASTSMIKLGGTQDMPTGPTQETSLGGSPRPNQSALAREAARRDLQRLQTLEVKLKDAIDKSQALKPFKDQLLINLTPEGLRIQIIDKENRPMFQQGRAVLMPYADIILKRIGTFLETVPNKISITGSTDAVKFRNGTMSNWLLSAERANAAREALIAGGMPKNRVAQLVGLSDTVLFNKKDPYAAVNRRISIIVLNKKAEATVARADQYAIGGKSAKSAPVSLGAKVAGSHSSGVTSPPAGISSAQTAPTTH